MNPPSASTPSFQNPKRPQGPAQSPEEDLSGTTLQGYQILAKIGRGSLGPVYQAVQAGIDRPVALKMLAPVLENHPKARMKFLLDARAKANLQDPHFIAVYEAGNVKAEQSHCFYAREYVDGETLSDLKARNETLSPGMAVRIIRHVATALAHLSRARIHHKLVSTRGIFITPDHGVRLNNLAIHEGVLTDPQKEIVGFGKLLLPLLHPDESPELYALVSRMTQPDSRGFLSFAALLQALGPLERRLKLAGPSRISADHAAAIRTVELIKKLKRCGAMLAVLGLFTLLPFAGYQACQRLFPSSATRDCSIQVEIPAGPFVCGSGEKVNLGTYWIDKYEVTLGQYGEFLDWIQAHPGEVARFEHENQPAGKSHIPSGWERMLAYAKWAMPARGAHLAPSHFNYPQFSVDYWDAYAYAKWRGRRLPTEQEWEKAARGTDGRLYPWGNQWKPNQCNAGGSMLPFLDHFSFGPVDAFAGDRSPFGVVGMAGNLREWTDSWDAATNHPVVRGGCFAGPEQDLRERDSSIQPGTRSESIGFRTCASK